MPRIDTDSIASSGTNFGFSKERLNQLGATEYTLVYIYVDNSGSTRGFADEITEMVKTVVESCRSSPRAKNLLVVVVGFADDLNEIHGAKMLSEIEAADYDGAFTLGTMTCLRDASAEMYERMLSDGRDLSEQDFEVNAIGFIITDGYDTCSKTGPERVKTNAKAIDLAEVLDSYRAILISVNNSDPSYKAEMDQYASSCGFDQVESIDDATPESLGKLAGFVSQSISSQSSQLGTGQPSKPLTF